MGNVVKIAKKFNHRWKTDLRFIKGFDYEKPEYADVTHFRTMKVALMDLRHRLSESKSVVREILLIVEKYRRLLANTELEPKDINFELSENFPSYGVRY